MLHFHPNCSINSSYKVLFATMQEILITGGAGFIGSHLQDRLLDIGHAVTVVDSLRTGRREQINKRATFYEVDIRDTENFARIIRDVNPQTIFHLAAQTHVPSSLKDPITDQEINIAGMINLMHSAKDTRVEKIVYSNTGGALYGEVPEDQLPIDEDQKTSPISFYGLSKLTAEHYMRLFGQTYSIDYLSLRYSNVFGPRQNSTAEGGVISIFIDRFLQREMPTIYGDGSHTRDYIFVDDVVEANILAMAYPNSDYFNISSATETSNFELYQLIASMLGINATPVFGPERPQDIRRSVLSNRKAREKLLWYPEIDLKTGIQLTIDSFVKE